MSYMDELIEYKNQVMKLLWENQDLKALLNVHPEEELTIEQFKKQVIPYNRNVETVTEQMIFIFVEVEPRKATSSAVMNYVLAFSILAHNDLNIKENGIVVDLIAQIIDQIFNGSRRFGIGMLEALGGPTFSTAKGFAGRNLFYQSKDFNQRGGKRSA